MTLGQLIALSDVEAPGPVQAESEVPTGTPADLFALASMRAG